MVRHFISGRSHHRRPSTSVGPKLHIILSCMAFIFVMSSNNFMYAHAMASETFAHVFQSVGDQLQQQQHNEQQQQLHRNIMHRPPGPVTPFRGNLKSLPKNHLQDSLENVLDANSNDHTHETTATGVRFPNHSLMPNIISSWEPEEYPDPWTNPILCSGANTASFTNEQQYHKDEIDKMPLLFCDPDQVLDKETLGNVAVQLRVFAETFASTAIFDGNEVVDFDTDTKDNDQLLNNESGEFREDVAKSSLDSLFGEDDDGLNRRLATQHDHSDSLPKSLRKRKLGTVASTEKRLYSDSVGGLFSTTYHRDKVAKRKELAKDHKIEVAIALVEKINLPAILHADSYFFYSDQDDMVNDAAQYFARYIHDTWSKRLAQEQQLDPPTNIVLIFISTLDRICYISSGTGVTTILPWWRLEHVVQDMKQDLRKGKTGGALSVAIEDLTELLLEGPPSFSDRVDDFFQRFGIILLFTVSTFLFATWGECRDRRKRIFFAERRSKMTAAEKEKAASLQKAFRTKMCPICLEPFDLTADKDSDIDINSLDKEQSSEKEKQKMKRFDSFGIPVIGTDDQPIKLLRCGHIFDKTCWEAWVDSGHGNPWICPICRQDVGRSATQRNSAGEGGDGDDARGSDENPNQEQSSLFERIVANAPGPSMSLIAPLSHPTFGMLHPILGMSVPPPIVGLSEQTPLFAQASTSNDVYDHV